MTADLEQFLRKTGRWHTAFSNSARWDEHGRCFYRENDEPEVRRPDFDFGTPNGDLIIDPWMQDIIKKP